MKFKPTLGRWLWFYPAAAGVNLFLMYDMRGSDSFLSIIGNLFSVVLIIAGAMVFYALLFTQYELGENDLIIKHGMSGPLKIPYKNIHSVKVKFSDDPWDLPSRARRLMSLDALEVLYSIGKKTRSVILICPKDKDGFHRELEERLETGGESPERSYQYEV